MGQECMPFGLKQTMGISGHCSEAQSGSWWKMSEVSGRHVEVSRRQWKAGKMVEGVRRYRKE